MRSPSVEAFRGGASSFRGGTLLETVTHARLRAEQGDAKGAVRILQAVLARRPGDAEARELLAKLPGGEVPRPEPEEPVAAAPTPASAAELARTFRRTLREPSAARRRLERFLDAVSRRAR
jgi:uncharacterized protein (DUF2267 family)